MTITKEYVASLCDHTLLKPAATPAEVLKLCAEAKQNSFAAVCVNGCYVTLVADALRGSSVKTAVTVGFPLGAMSTAAKAFETAQAVADGANEIDMVLNIGALKDCNHSYVENDIRAVVVAAKGAPVKVIIETCLLSEAEKIIACELSVKAGAAFVKTSTGLSTGGATVEDIRLMRSIVGPNIGVKASGGIRTKQDALDMIEAGANRIGTGSAMSIIAGFDK